MPGKLAQASQKKRFSNRDLAVNRRVNDSVLTRIFDYVGREEMAAALLHSSDPRAQTLHSMLLDPAFRRCTFSHLCHKVGFTMGDILDVYIQFQFDLALLKASRNYRDILKLKRRLDRCTCHP